MRLPKRRHQLLKIQEDEGPVYVTPRAEQRLKDDLHDLEKNQRPRIVEDLTMALQKGDLSENAEYQDAKARLGRIDGRVFSIKERLKRVVLIETNAASETVQIGSTVVLSLSTVPGLKRTYRIVGSHESNPAQGRISHQAPLGSALLNRTVGETVSIATPNGEVIYRIEEIQ